MKKKKTYTDPKVQRYKERIANGNYSNVFCDAKPGDIYLRSDGTRYVYHKHSDIPDNPFPHQLYEENVNPDSCGPVCYTNEGINAFAVVDDWNDYSYMSIIKKL